MLKWTMTRKEMEAVSRICDRLQEAGIELNRASVQMDLDAAHSNGCPMKLAELANASVADMIHDIGGIRHHMNRKTGKLGGSFLPRYAV